MPRTVRVIPATIDRYTEIPLEQVRKRRVAAYARVSTEYEEQQSSFKNQVEYYTSYIKSRADWEFAGMYTDDGISGTNTKKREGFNKMIQDALAGHIDLIITKSVSRFARNTVDSLTTVRKLKAKGIEIYFEKENIWTLDSKGELLITIMSSLAQEESRSISENVTWGHRKRFAAGKGSLAYSHFLGYDKGEDGKMVINPEQAETVREIYRLFLAGYAYHTIGRKLEEQKIPTPAGKTKWSPSTIMSILKNEKYKGDALLQKGFTVDFLTKKMKKNEGEVPQYYVEGDHEAIISPETFDLVQEEMKKRKRGRTKHSGLTIFSSKIICGECGSAFGPKVWHSTDKYRRTIYRCNHKFQNGKKCNTPYVTEEEIKEKFIEALNALIQNKQTILEDIDLMRKIISETQEKKKELTSIEYELTRLETELTNATQLGENYEEKYQSLVNRYNTEKDRHDKLEEELTQAKAQDERLVQFAKDLKTQDPIKAFDEILWCTLLDHVTVFTSNDIEFTFKNGTTITS